MPFTPSHAVVALPFARTALSAAAVATGAMTPDVPLFLRGGPLGYDVTHDIRWLPLTIAVALVLLLVWRCVLRPAARELSPGWLAARLPASWDAGAAASARETLRPGRRGSHLLLLVAALAIGVISHIAWDAFTHEGRAGSLLVPALADDWGPLPGYTWLQHGSSLVGLAVLAVAAAVWVRARHPLPVMRTVPSWVRIAWWVSAIVPLVVGAAAFTPLDLPYTPEQLAYAVLPPLYAVWAALTLALCVAVQSARRRVKAAERPVPDA